MEHEFRSVVEHIFNNWTALQLAIEHGMGGTNSQQVLSSCIDYMSEYCLSNLAIDAKDVQEALEDVAYEEFDLICEDGSILEIGTTLYRFVTFIREGDRAKFEATCKNLPVRSNMLQTKKISSEKHENCGKSVANDELQMEQDSEWTEIMTRRKRNI